jgi:hypothetical protein
MKTVGAWWHSVAHNFREGGLGRVFGKIGRRFGDWLWSESAWLIYRVDLGSYGGEPALQLVRREMGFDALREKGYYKAVMFPEAIRGRLERAQRCNGFFLNDELVNVAWTTRGRLIVERGVSIEDADCLGIYDCFTLPAHRSKGIYKDTLVCILGSARRDGFKRALIAVDLNNIPSIRGIEGAGFAPLYELIRRRRFGRQSLSRTEFRRSAQTRG